jgi:hypothetical protein
VQCQLKQLFVKKIHSNYRISKTRGKVVPFDMVMLPVVPCTSHLKSLMEIVQAILELTRTQNIGFLK